MVQELAPIQPQQLKLYEPEHRITTTAFKCPNEYFVARYPEQFKQFGSAFLELHQPVDSFSVNILPISISLDFFASVLGSAGPNHHVIYLESELAWYFKDRDNIYKTTSGEKLANLFRALLVKCAESMPANVNKLNLFHEWRSDKTAKSVVNRAKSILSADASFFSPTSPNQRIRGVELHERIARKFVEEMLTCESGKILLLADAYIQFLKLVRIQNLEPVKRSDFKAMVTPLIKEQFNVALRNDLIDQVELKQKAGWKGLRVAA